MLTAIPCRPTPWPVWEPCGSGACLSSPSPPTARPSSDLRELKPDKEPRTDAYGDPLPPDALARLGTLRFRSVSFFAFTADGKTIVRSEGVEAGQRTAHRCLRRSLAARRPGPSGNPAVPERVFLRLHRRRQDHRPI